MKLIHPLAVAVTLLATVPASASLVLVTGPAVLNTSTQADNFGIARDNNVAGSSGTANVGYDNGTITFSEVNLLIVFSDSGTSFYKDYTGGAGSGAYDGSEDSLIGAYNIASTTVTSVGLGGGSTAIFGFDGDGIGHYTGFPTGKTTIDQTHGAGDPNVGKTLGNTSDGSGTTANPNGQYGGPITTFTAINAATTQGTVNFTGGLASGQSTYFSLEEAPNTILGGGISTVPEPTSLLLGATAVLGMMSCGWLRRKRAVKAATTMSTP